MRKYQTGLPLLAALLLAACSAPSVHRQAPPADIEVVRGPTSIVGGNAKGEQDITVRTPHLAFAISLGEAEGQKGALVDLALVENGLFGADRVASLDFVPGEGELRLVDARILEHKPERLVIELTREWNGNTLISRYEVARDDAGIRLSSRLQTPARETLFAGYRLLRNEPGSHGSPSYNEVPRMVHTHWTAAQLQNELGILYESDDLRRPHKPDQKSEFNAWLNAGSLGSLLADKEMYAGAGRAELGLLELTPLTAGFEAQLQELRQRWSRGEKVYLSANPVLRGPRQNTGKLYAYTPKGRLTADYASAAAKGHSFLSFGPEVFPITTNFGGTAAPFSESQVEFRSEVGLARAEVWLDGKQVAGWSINGAKWFRTGVPVPPNHTWMQWVVEDRYGNRAYSNPIWIK